MLGRIYSLALLAITIEALVNGFRQLQYLNFWVFVASATAAVIAVVGVFISQWFVEAHTLFWLRAEALVSMALLITWPLHFQPSDSLPDGFQPWIWWTLGIAAVAAATTFRFSIGVSYLLVIAISWPILKTSPYGGSGQLLGAIQDSLLLFIFVSILVAMVIALRWEAAKTDSANQQAISSAVESARVDAIELERSRLDALVHDSVLTTLLIASRATTSEQISSASKSAAEAIARLELARSGGLTREEMSLASLFSALEMRVKEHAQEFDVSVDRVSDLPIPPEIAEALTEATLQAVDNSLKHAGNASERVVRLKGSSRGLKIVVSDNGRGFRPSQVSRDRLGISKSIVARVALIGGRTFINASPGKGTTVIIEWGSDD
jgi:signal transduction histidine kinase